MEHFVFYNSLNQEFDLATIQNFFASRFCLSLIPCEGSIPLPELNSYDKQEYMLTFLNVIPPVNGITEYSRQGHQKIAVNIFLTRNFNCSTLPLLKELGCLVVVNDSKTTEEIIKEFFCGYIPTKVTYDQEPMVF